MSDVITVGSKTSTGDTVLSGHSSVKVKNEDIAPRLESKQTSDTYRVWGNRKGVILNKEEIRSKSKRKMYEPKTKKQAEFRSNESIVINHINNVLNNMDSKVEKNTSELGEHLTKQDIRNLVLPVDIGRSTELIARDQYNTLTLGGDSSKAVMPKFKNEPVLNLKGKESPKSIVSGVKPTVQVKNGSIKSRIKKKGAIIHKSAGRKAELIARDLYNKYTDIAKGENVRHLTNYQHQKRQQRSHEPSYSRTDYTRLQGSWGYSGGKCSPK
ncbi:TPA: hypothetical protein ACX6RU_001621 [Photobacterium damselae]